MPASTSTSATAAKPSAVGARSTATTPLRTTSAVTSVDVRHGRYPGCHGDPARSPPRSPGDVGLAAGGAAATGRVRAPATSPSPAKAGGEVRMSSSSRTATSNSCMTSGTWASSSRKCFSGSTPGHRRRAAGGVQLLQQQVHGQGGAADRPGGEQPDLHQRRPDLVQVDERVRLLATGGVRRRAAGRRPVRTRPSARRTRSCVRRTSGGSCGPGCGHSRYGPITSSATAAPTRANTAAMRGSPHHGI